MFVKYGLYAAVLFAPGFFSCLPVDSPQPPLLEKPVLQLVGMAPVPDPVDGYHEAVHLTWTFDRSDNQPLQSFTILRKITADSLFDVFRGSRLIPADTVDFYDELKNYVYPRDGFDSVQYRIYATDSLGRNGDTSAVCGLRIAPQPRLVSLNDTAGCLAWESWIRGGIDSWCVVWSDENHRKWTSRRIEEFPFTDEPARFSACLPDSLRSITGLRWFCALYIKANEALSLRIEAFDAP